MINCKYIIIILLLIIIINFIIKNKVKNKNKDKDKHKVFESKQNDTKKIAFCFLIYDKINQEELWNDFFNTLDKNKYNIYIHYKINKPLKYFEQYKLKNCVPTKYGDVSLIHAHNLLFKKALEDSSNYKFVNLSQSCIPLKKSSYIYDFLTKDNMGHFNYLRINYLNFFAFKKTSEWFILNRNLAELVTSIDVLSINYIFENHFAPEELYFLTLIYNNKMENQVVITNNLANSATTFTNWNDMNYNYKNTVLPMQNYFQYYNLSKPKNYETISKEEIDYLIKDSLCLFGRKFDTMCDLSYVKELIIH